MRAVIFVGPTLPPQSRPTDSFWEWQPPAKQGECYRAALTRPAAIGIIDGYFEVVPTVWHKEILWAMAEGVHVFGAASIGALRAAELDTFGMRGVGRIYENFRDGVLEDDDEVAVLHGPEELGYPPVTEAMANIRATVAEGVRLGIVKPDIADHLTGIAKALFYKERTYEAVIRAAEAAGLPSASLRDFGEWLRHERVDQKREDADAMLDTIRTHLAAGTGPMRATYDLADTVAWRAARRRDG
jgi:hypothetical protein